MSLPKLKLNFGNRTLSSGGLPPTPGGIPPTPGASTPATPGGSKPLKLKFTTNSNPPTPAPAPVEDAPKPKKTKAGRQPKPSAKVTESKKRERVREEDDDDEGSTINVQPAAKKVKIQFKSNPGIQSATTPKTPVVLKAKVKGKQFVRQPGEGYDSEASDCEQDPHIEEQFVLRMYPGEDCEYLQKAIVEKKIGVPKSQGGADVSMKFFADGRKAAVTIRGHCYAAIIVDLPCVIEGMKSWDRRGWWKSADICQMMWVYAKVSSPEEAKNCPLPKIIDGKTFQYPHGLTPPMHYARKRRFRKRISRTAIEQVEAAVEKLLAADKDAKATRWEMINPDPDPGASEDEDQYGDEDEDEDEDAEGEADDGGYFNGVHHNDQEIDHDADLEADLEAAMQESLGETPMSTTDATPVVTTETPAAEEEEEDSGDDSIEGDEEEEDGVTVEDEETKVREAERQGVLEDIADLERRIETLQVQMTTQPNPILRKRLEDNIRKVKAELQLKKASIEAGDDD